MLIGRTADNGERFENGFTVYSKKNNYMRSIMVLDAAYKSREYGSSLGDQVWRVWWSSALNPYYGTDPASIRSFTQTHTHELIKQSVSINE